MTPSVGSTKSNQIKSNHISLIVPEETNREIWSLKENRGLITWLCYFYHDREIIAQHLIWIPKANNMNGKLTKLKIPQYTRLISHIVQFWKEMCTFLFWVMHYEIWKRWKFVLFQLPRSWSAMSMPLVLWAISRGHQPGMSHNYGTYFNRAWQFFQSNNFSWFGT